MFAVIKTGGKQYRVAKDDIIVVEKLLGAPGELIKLENVLMLGEDGKDVKVGAPLVDKAAVFAEVLKQGKADKVLVFKKKRRQNYRRLKGHRQEETVLRIADISATGTAPKGAAKPAAKKAAPKKADEQKTEAKDAAPEKKAAAKKAAPKKEAAKKEAAPKKEAKAKAEPKAAEDKE